MKTIDRFEGDYRFLSNFYDHPVFYYGQRWPTSEHAYQAAKFNDSGVRNMIRNSCGPADAKRIANAFKPQTWVDFHIYKLTIMEQILREKFKDDTLRGLLWATGDAELIEGNTWGDVYWGVCKGKGENHLGKILMKVRADQAELSK